MWSTFSAKGQALAHSGGVHMMRCMAAHLTRAQGLGTQQQSHHVHATRRHLAGAARGVACHWHGLRDILASQTAPKRARGHSVASAAGFQAALA
jgi:heme oxygenase